MNLLQVQKQEKDRPAFAAARLRKLGSFLEQFPSEPRNLDKNSFESKRRSIPPTGGFERKKFRINTRCNYGTDSAGFDGDLLQSKKMLKSRMIQLRRPEDNDKVVLKRQK